MLKLNELVIVKCICGIMLSCVISVVSKMFWRTSLAKMPTGSMQIHVQPPDRELQALVRSRMSLSKQSTLLEEWQMRKMGTVWW